MEGPAVLIEIENATRREFLGVLAAAGLLVLADVDVILLRINAGTAGLDRESSLAITRSPLWAGLPAAQSGAVFEISGDLFYSSPLTASANLDWAEQNLLT